MPKKIVLSVLMLSAVTVLSAQWLEMGLEGQFSNLYLRPERTPTDNAFDGLSDLYYNGNFYFVSELSPGVSIRTGYESDPVLRRKLYSYVIFQQSLVTFTVGPYYGLLNTTRKWFLPGANLDFRLDMPQLLFLTLGFSTSFSPLSADGDYYHSGQRGSFGFYVPFGIITIGAEYRTFQTLKDTFIIRDEWIKGGIATEVFFKNFPLRYTAIIEYDSLQRDYVGGDTHQLMSLIFGNKFFWEVNPGLALYALIDLSVFSFGWEELNYAVSSNLPLGRATLGMRFRFAAADEN